MTRETDAQAASLRSRLLVAMLTPLTVLLGAGALLGYQIQTLDSNARSVDHTDAVIATTYETLKGILDQETAVRGFMLADDSAFLTPYRQVAPEETLDELYRLVGDNPSQQRRVRDLRRTYLEWLPHARTVVDGKDLREARSRSGMWERKQRMDHMREITRQILDAEQILRVQRARELDLTREVTRYGLVGLLGLCGFLIAFVGRRQVGAVAETFEGALSAEREIKDALAAEGWVRERQVELAGAIQGDISVDELCARALKTIALATEADVGAMYLSEGDKLRRTAAYAQSMGSGVGPLQFQLGEGLLGQAALDNRFMHLKEVPADYLVVRSGTGQRDVSEVLLIPLGYEGRLFGALELGFLRPLTARVLALSQRVGEALAVAIRSAEYKRNLREYLEETQRQAEELATQQEELRVANEELSEQSGALREAQQKLEQQQAELEQTNEGLTRQATLLEQHNDELRHAQDALAAKAAEVARANQFKSEFLANMSHELRTPLNSTLILAKLLADNKDHNLSLEQVKFAETIYSAGNDLLVLINDVLDLSRIEAGKMDVHGTELPLARLIEPVQRIFEPVARQKGVQFELQIEHNGVIETDVARVQQILRNLLSNAFKFSERGAITLRADADDAGFLISVKDSGIGIAEENREAIFEAFRQADGTTHRKYGGTGLGLSISRDLARLLGGDLWVESRLGEGSTFWLRLPRRLAPGVDTTRQSALPEVVQSAPAALPALFAPATAPLDAPRSEPPKAHTTVNVDDRNQLISGRRVLLVVEDDSAFAGVVMQLAHELEFQCLIAESADEGVRLAQKFLPSAIILDIGLPDHSGLSVLDRVKRDARTRHIPVHVISATDVPQVALSMGAVGYALKPVTREQLVHAVEALTSTFSKEGRVVLVVEDDAVQRESVTRLLGGPGVTIVAVDSVESALAELTQHTFDCIVTDLSFPNASGYDLLETLAKDDGYAFPPVIVYTGRSLTSEQEQRLRRFSSSIIVKGARSPERLLDEVTLFLHQVESSLPPDRQRMLRAARDREAIFEGRTILLAEDDVRNVFALVSLLEPKGAKVEIARNGREALERLEQNPDTALVLMDVMMPEMDGLTATREIRKQQRFQKLPIIALTAKAMPDDQEKCLKAGASDYVSKPFDVDMLLSLLRVWLAR